MFGAYQRWCRTTSTRAQYFEKMLEMCGLIDDPDCPKAGRHVRWRELRLRNLRRQFSVPFLLYAISQIHSLWSTRTASTAWHLVLLFPLRWSWMYSVLKQLVRRPRMRSSKITSSMDHLRRCSLSQSKGKT